jgi:hypothetical protein
MTKHTPGPWATGNTDQLLFGRKQGNGTEPIGFVYGPSFPERSEVGQRALADARLIAAAPELLEALQGMCIALENIGGEHVTGREGSEERLEAAYAAIARATGANP